MHVQYTGYVSMSASGFCLSDVSGFGSVADQKEDKVEVQAENEAPEAQPSAATMDHFKTSASVSVSKPDAQPAASQTKLLCVLKDQDGKLKIASSQPAQEPEIDVSVIPPPSDFMDEPAPPPLLQRAPEPDPSALLSSKKPQTSVDLEQLRQRAASKVSQEPSNKPPELSPAGVGHRTSPPPEAVEPKSPPAVAPKPKRLPANIILKTHRPTVSDGSSGHSVASSGDRALLDPERVHMEALRKLGLLKSDEADSGPSPSPKLSPQTRRSWATSPPVSPRTPPTTPSYSRLSTPSPAPLVTQSPVAASPLAPSTPLTVPPPFIVPAPAAFSDADQPSPPESELSAAKDVTVATGEALNTPPHSPLTLIKQLTPARRKGARSATLERSGSGLSSYTLSQDSGEVTQDGSDKQSPSQLRNSRPRPASLGSREEFSGTKGGGSQVGHASSKEPDLRRSLPAFQPSPKLPRSQGISVLICPRSQNENERQEALRRLGLLRD